MMTIREDGNSLAIQEGQTLLLIGKRVLTILTELLLFGQSEGQSMDKEKIIDFLQKVQWEGSPEYVLVNWPSILKGSKLEKEAQVYREAKNDFDNKLKRLADEYNIEIEEM